MSRVPRTSRQTPRDAMGADRLREIIELADEAGGLRDREEGFIEDMRGRLDRWGDEITITPAQAQWLEDIERRLKEG